MTVTTTPPRFSLVVATVGRTLELKRLLLSLTQQSLKDFEVLLIDQNSDDRVPSLIEEMQFPFPCYRFHCSVGVSRARNLGLLHAKGQILAFPDDDCWYPQDLLDQTSMWFEEHPSYQFLLCCSRDEKMQLSASRWPNESSAVERNNILRTCLTAGLFVLHSAALAIGPFDETLGPGSNTLYGSGEDTDYGLRLLAAKQRGWYEQEFYFHHPSRDPRQTSRGTRRAFLYGSGHGHLLRKHRYPVVQIAESCLRALGGAAYFLLFGRLRAVSFYLASFVGRIYGYLF
jgi:glycosyltransferase involved in cell wall biosynthesis